MQIFACWLTDSGRLTHKVVTRPAISLAQDRESSPAVTGVLTTMLHHQFMHSVERLIILIALIARLIILIAR